MILNNVEEYILKLKKPDTQEESVKYFKYIYESFSIDQWLKSNLSFELVNFILYNRPDLLCIAIRINVQVN